MDLSPTPAQQELAAAARTAFAAGSAAPVAEGALTDLAVVAIELGRAAGPPSFHREVLARLLRWSGRGSVAVATAPVAELVAGAASASTILVARSPGSVASFPSERLVLRARGSIDDADRADVDATGVAPDATWSADVDGALARAAVLLAADAAGAAAAALDAAVAHVKLREQWGRPLGSLQAVQHRSADMLLDVTMATDAVFDAAGRIDRGEPAVLAAAYAKAGAVERCRRVTASAHQLAGGQGIDADSPYHRWYRRVRAAELELGGSRLHRAMVARSLL